MIDPKEIDDLKELFSLVCGAEVRLWHLKQNVPDGMTAGEVKAMLAESQAIIDKNGSSGPIGEQLSALLKKQEDEIRQP